MIRFGHTSSAYCAQEIFLEDKSFLHFTVSSITTAASKKTAVSAHISKKRNPAPKIKSLMFFFTTTSPLDLAGLA